MKQLRDYYTVFFSPLIFVISTTDYENGKYKNQANLIWIRLFVNKYLRAVM